MIRTPLFRRAAFVLAAALAAASPGWAAPERRFTTSPTQSMEASLLIRLLEEVQYNHGAIHESDYGAVVPDYMKELDSQHLFFLDTDRQTFASKYDAKTVYANLAYLGNIDAAYEMYRVYTDRVKARAAWIQARLAQGIDFSDNTTFAADRSKADWPASMDEADEIWAKRLRFELIGEMLDKKTPEQAKAEVRKRYQRMLKNIGQTDADDLAELYLTAVTALYDPHSNYFSADDYADFSIQMRLHLVGIGAILQSKDDYCTVKELVPGGPADLGHQLKPEDKITAVGQADKEPTEIIGMRLRDIVNQIRGGKGTRVHLVVDRPGVPGHKDVYITRDDVKLNSARAHGAVFQVPDEAGRSVPIGVISLPEFYGPADDPHLLAEKTSASLDCARLIADMKKAGIRGLVLDLRNNGGGFLTEAINVAGLFIPPHGPVVQVRDNEGQIQVNRDDYSQVAWDGPLAVLENRLSASASEIVAGALQNYGRAIVIGDTSTHGKGTVQTVLEMKNISRALQSAPKTGAAKITVQKFYLPNGSSTQLEGVKADIVLPSIDDYLPIGESSLPHALIWDRIPSAIFDGHPLDPRVVAALRRNSQDRQRELEEFNYLRRNVDWFKTKEEQKLISLNLDERRKQQVLDDAFKKEMEAERKKLAKQDFALQEFRVAPAPPPRIKAKESDSDQSDPTELSTDEDDSTPYRVDVELREALRVVDDAIGLGHDRSYWAYNHPPLTVASTLP